MKLLDFLGDKSVETYFDEKIKECENMTELPRELKNCTCCENHRKNFPIFEMRMEKGNKSKITFGKDCSCPCRHIARHLCREWELIHEVEEIDSEEDISEDEDSGNSLDDFIVPDKGFKKKEKKELDKALNMFRGKKSLRR